MAGDSLKPGLHEALLTRRLEQLLTRLTDGALLAEVAELRDAEAADRVSRHVAGIVARAIDRAPEGRRSDEALRIASELIRRLQSLTDRKHDLDGDELLDPAQVLVALLRRLPDGSEGGTCAALAVRPGARWVGSDGPAAAVAGGCFLSAGG